jgi:hypothetical protein
MNVFEKNKNIPIELHLPIDFHFGFFENRKNPKATIIQKKGESRNNNTFDKKKNIC